MASGGLAALRSHQDRPPVHLTRGVVRGWLILALWLFPAPGVCRLMQQFGAG